MKKIIDHQKRLIQLRKKIDKADRLILTAFAARFKAVREVGKLKKSIRMPVVQKTRWNEVMRGRIKMGKKMDISPKFTRSVYNLIHSEAVRLQQKK